MQQSSKVRKVEVAKKGMHSTREDPAPLNGPEDARREQGVRRSRPRAWLCYHVPSTSYSRFLLHPRGKMNLYPTRFTDLS